MRIHQITHLFHPDSLGGAALYTDMARFLRDRGHDVRVTTTFSYYPKLHYNEADRRSVVRDENFENIPLRRIAMVLPRRHQGWRRLIPEATYLWRLRRRGRFSGWEPDVVLTACPMLAQPLAAAKLYPLGKVPIVLVVQDLMADAALRLGIIRQPGLGKALVWAERRALMAAKQVVAIADGLQNRLQAIGLSSDKITVVPNWIHKSLQSESDRPATKNEATRSLALFYSGNLGVKQGFPDFLKDFLASCGAWSLCVYGDGAEAANLRAAQGSHPSFSMGSLLPEPEYVKNLRSATACLVTQRKGAGDSFLPSKLLPALACGKPVLAICELASPLGREVAEHGFGVVLEPGDRVGLSAVLKRWQNNPGERTELGRLALERASFFHRDRILPRYEELLIEVAERNKRNSSSP